MHYKEIRTLKTDSVLVEHLPMRVDISRISTVLPNVAQKPSTLQHLQKENTTRTCSHHHLGGGAGEGSRAKAAGQVEEADPIGGEGDLIHIRIQIQVREERLASAVSEDVAPGKG